MSPLDEVILSTSNKFYEQQKPPRNARPELIHISGRSHSDPGRYDTRGNVDQEAFGWKRGPYFMEWQRGKLDLQFSSIDLFHGLSTVENSRSSLTRVSMRSPRTMKAVTASTAIR